MGQEPKGRAGLVLYKSAADKRGEKESVEKKRRKGLCAADEWEMGVHMIQTGKLFKKIKDRFWKRKEKEEDIMYIIAGLGNPTRQYEKTRHNIGFDAVDAMALQYQIKMKEIKNRSVCGSGMIGGQKVLLIKPQTFMNNSGEAVGAWLKYYKLDAATQLLVIYDDISLEPGSIRIRLKGSAGGHNGIKNIIAHAGTQEFARIKIGVGQKPQGWDLADYVLGHFSEEDRRKTDNAIKDAIAAAELIVSGQSVQAMNLYNKKKV